MFSTFYLFLLLTNCSEVSEPDKQSSNTACLVDISLLTHPALSTWGIFSPFVQECSPFSSLLVWKQPPLFLRAVVPNVSFERWEQFWPLAMCWLVLQKEWNQYVEGKYWHSYRWVWSSSRIVRVVNTAIHVYSQELRLAPHCKSTASLTEKRSMKATLQLTLKVDRSNRKVACTP